MQNKCLYDGGQCGIGGFCAACPLIEDVPDNLEEIVGLFLREHQSHQDESINYYIALMEKALCKRLKESPNE